MFLKNTFQKAAIIATLSLGCLSALPAKASDNVVNLFNWSGYLSPRVAEQFTKETGIKINQTTFDSNEILYTKLKADPHSSYDIIIPSSYMIARMMHEHMLHPLDKSQLSNLQNIDPNLLNKAYDPGNRYSIPYLWGTTAIILNQHYYDPNYITRWSDFWQPNYRGKLALADDMRDVFSMALIVLGYSVNDENPTHIRAAYQKLKQLWPNVMVLTSDGAEQMYVNEDCTIGMFENGNTYSIAQENPAVTYRYPKEGAMLWIDNMSIPRYATHLKNAYRLMNFLMRPEIAAEQSEDVGFATPNLPGKKLLPNAIRKNPILYPDNTVMRHAHVESALSNAANRLYIRYWQLLKLQ